MPQATIQECVQDQLREYLAGHSRLPTQFSYRCCPRNHTMPRCVALALGPGLWPSAQSRADHMKCRVQAVWSWVGSGSAGGGCRLTSKCS